jgi:hypothetical protein
VRALSALFGQLTQFGELIRQEPDPGGAGVRAALEEAARGLLRAASIMNLRVNGFYGGLDLLLNPGVAQSREEFGVAALDLGVPEEAAWRGVHEKHRSWIRKAERLGVAVTETDDPEILVRLLDESYAGQDRAGPNRAYVRHALVTLRAASRAVLYVASSEGRPLAAAMVHRLGGVAYYDFGGVARNRTGAGHLLHWWIARRLREEGVRRYVLGQVAGPGGHPDPHFAEGITRFKRSFGTVETPSCSARFVPRPWRQAAWRLLSEWTSRRSARSSTAGPPFTGT